MRLPVARRLGGLRIQGDYTGNVVLTDHAGATVWIEAADIPDVVQALLETHDRHKGR